MSITGLHTPTASELLTLKAMRRMLAREADCDLSRWSQGCSSGDVDQSTPTPPGSSELHRFRSSGNWRNDEDSRV